MSLLTGKIVRIEHEEEAIQGRLNEVAGDYVVLTNHENLDVDSYWWAVSELPSLYLVSLIDGSRIRLADKSASISSIHLSPNNRTVIFWNSDKASWVTYSINDSSFHLILSTNQAQFSSQHRKRIPASPVSDIGGWLENGNKVLLYDQFDIWAVELSGKRKSLNVTGEYGRAKRISLRLITDGNPQIGELVLGQDVILTGFDERNKYNGFFKLNVKDKSVTPLSMGAFTFFKLPSQTGEYWYFSRGMMPVKAIKQSMKIFT
jgi:hypothetical protein